MSQPSPQPHKDYVSIPEYARQLGISRIAVYKKVKQGLIPAKKVGRNYVIPTDANRVQQQQALRHKQISIPKLAEELGISRIAVYQQVKSGKIKAEKVGRNYVIPVGELTAPSPIVTQPAVTKIKSVMTIPELAAQLGISRIAVYQQVKSGKIKARKVGRNYAIEPQELTGFPVTATSQTKSKTEDYLSLPECARELGMSRFALYQKVKKGQIKAKQIGRNFVIHRKEVSKHGVSKRKKRAEGKK